MNKELFTKPMSELTIVDQLKLNGIVIAFIAGGVATIGLTGVVIEEARSMKQNRKLKKKEAKKNEEK